MHLNEAMKAKMAAMRAESDDSATATKVWNKLASGGTDVCLSKLLSCAMADGHLPEFPRTCSEVLPSFDSCKHELTISAEQWIKVFGDLHKECMAGVALKILVPEAAAAGGMMKGVLPNTVEFTYFK